MVKDNNDYTGCLLQELIVLHKLRNTLYIRAKIKKFP